MMRPNATEGRGPDVQNGANRMSKFGLDQAWRAVEIERISM